MFSSRAHVVIDAKVFSLFTVRWAKVAELFRQAGKQAANHFMLSISSHSTPTHALTHALVVRHRSSPAING